LSDSQSLPSTSNLVVTLGGFKGMHRQSFTDTARRMVTPQTRRMAGCFVGEQHSQSVTLSVYILPPGSTSSFAEDDTFTGPRHHGPHVQVPLLDKRASSSFRVVGILLPGAVVRKTCVWINTVCSGNGQCEQCDGGGASGTHTHVCIAVASLLYLCCICCICCISEGSCCIGLLGLAAISVLERTLSG
jgi:hypothetical protein